MYNLIIVLLFVNNLNLLFKASYIIKNNHFPLENVIGSLNLFYSFWTDGLCPTLSNKCDQP